MKRSSDSGMYLVVLTAFLYCASGCSGDSHQTASELADAIVTAHGGWDVWLAAPSVSYDHTLIFGKPENVWASTEVAETRAPHRLYQVWNDGGSFLAWNGTEVWTRDWSLDNPPAVMPFLTHFSIIAPWLTTETGVRLEGPGTESLPGDTLTMYRTLTIILPFDSTQPPHATYYKIYADPETFLMKGVSYGVSYGRLLDLMNLPADIQEIGPMTHIFETYEQAEGLTVPTKYYTIGPGGGIAGTHTAENWSFTRPFEESMLVKTDDGVTDNYQHSRKVASR